MINPLYFGLDVGEKTVGIAFSQGYYAQPFKTVVFANQDYQQAATEVALLCKEQKITHVVIGLPKHMNNDIGVSAERAILFKDLLEKHVDATIIMWDERLTSKEANRSMISLDMSRKKRKQLIDQMAAVIILQSYLDARR
jgi:putative holliday junction resolvase